MLNKKFNNIYIHYIIYFISILIPLIVYYLIFSLDKNFLNISKWVYILPHINVLINISNSLVLMLGFFCIKKKKIILHKRLMMLAFFLGFIFLVFYLTYHFFLPSTIYGDINGNEIFTKKILNNIKYSRIIYLLILFSHILSSIVVTPLIFLSFFYALTERIIKHKNIAKYTFLLWMYVSITGVIVYIMISPFYLKI